MRHTDVDVKDKLCLEIGVFEGKTTIHFIEHGAKKVICIDPWLNTYLPDIDHRRWAYFKGQYEGFLKNINPYLDKVEIYRDFSNNAIKELYNKYKEQVDVIYIDGDHRENAVYADGKNYLPLLKANGVMCFDDYKWRHEDIITAKGINRFLKEFKDDIAVMHKGDQVIIRKLKKEYRPAMAGVEISIIDGLLKTLQPQRCLEWGCGHSTLYWPQKFDFIKKWVAVENNPIWYNKIRARMSPNVELHLKKLDSNYYNFVRGQKFDFILVDGIGLRVECLMMASKIMSEGGIALLHDAGRDCYKRGYKFFPKHELLYPGELPIGNGYYKHRGLVKFSK